MNNKKETKKQFNWVTAGKIVKYLLVFGFIAYFNYKLLNPWIVFVSIMVISIDIASDKYLLLLAMILRKYHPNKQFENIIKNKALNSEQIEEMHKLLINKSND